MRTAAEILSENAFVMNGIVSEELAIKAINEARIEAIKEAAEVSRTRTNDESTSIIVDKQTILNLINEIK